MSRDCNVIIQRLENKLDEVGVFDTDDVDTLVRSAGVVLDLGGSAVLKQEGNVVTLVLKIDTGN